MVLLPSLNKLYNGNIAETAWTTGSDFKGIIRRYGYLYDKLNRLQDATYQTPSQTDNKNYFGENLDYDKNGNIIRLERMYMAVTLTNPYADAMDNLGYFYKDDSNLLMKVTDRSNQPQGFKDDSNGFNDSTDDYDYDVNGNLIKDENKNITKIEYNQLNLPKKIIFGTTGTIEYIYNAAGQKLEKIVTDNGVVTSTNYLDGFQYKDNVLEFFPTTEGYVKNESGALSYVFQYKDHLGNVRVSYAKNPQSQVLEIIEENNYYPFGLKHKGYNDYLPTANKYKFNGKELEDELGLNMYDMDMRQYDPAIARWVVHDPIVHHSQSPYSAFNGNPIYWADPSGMAGAHYNWNTGGYENGSGQSIFFSEAMGSYGLNTDGSKKTDATESTTESTTTSANINPKDAFGYEKKYPRTMAVLRQLRGYVKSNPEILKKLSEWSGYSTMEVLDKLKYSNSSILMGIKELESIHQYNPEGLTESSSLFFLNIGNAKKLETVQNNDELQIFSFFVGATILHEFVHAGRIANKLDPLGVEKDEMGWGWERDAFGGHIQNGSVYKDEYKDYLSENKWLVKKYKWSFKDVEYKYPPLF